MDFPSHTQFIGLTPLAHSYTENDVESDLRRLFIDLFDAHLSEMATDANMLGVAHLASFDLVRQAINADGLILLQGDREQEATRYLSRAWKARNTQGRGLHFLRTYLQLLFPDDWELYQLWHESTSDDEYPDCTHRLMPGYKMHFWCLGEDGRFLDGSLKIGKEYYERDASIGEEEISLYHLFLSNRVELTLGSEVTPQTFFGISRIVSACIPARFILLMKFWRDRVLSEPNDIDRWNLGDDAGCLGDPVLVTSV